MVAMAMFLSNTRNNVILVSIKSFKTSIRTSPKMCISNRLNFPLKLAHLKAPT